ncbi:hypothetical protein L0Y65_03460 [Candidatus Micrarchaeota archaeon]|nr:hypothetical protein [Candidatus Micrarchaeota archaeon]
MKALTALLIILMAPVAFAAWQGTAAVAIMTSAGILGIIYMIGMGFGINELQMTAKEEFFQLIAMMVMIALLVGGDSILNAISANPAFSGSGSTTLQGAANASIDITLANVTALMDSIAETDHDAAIEGSKASSCSILGMGYSVSGCGSYTMLSAPLSMAGGITGFAVGELYTMKRLIELSTAFAFPFLLPLGIVLRTFKFTRGAGGLLIALAISLHILLPMGVIFNDMLGATFLDPPGAADDALSAPYQAGLQNVTLECNPGATGEEWWSGDSNAANAVRGYHALRDNLRVYLFTMLVQATLGPVLALLMMSTGLRTLTSLAGAEVDVSAISRFV